MRPSKVYILLEIFSTVTIQTVVIRVVILCDTNISEEHAARC
jgi:hypothetical protein